MVDPSQWQNELLALRMKNLFTPPQSASTAPDPTQQVAQPAPVQPQAQPQSQMPPQVNPGMANSLYQPQTTAADAYTKLMQSMPQQSQYAPSKLRQLGAVIAGMGAGRPAGVVGGQPVGYVGDPAKAAETAHAISTLPFNQAMSNWQAAEKPAAQAATIEEAKNRAMQTYDSSMQLRGIQQQNADTRRQAEADRDKANTELNRIRDENATTRRNQEALNDWSKKNPDRKIQVTPQGVFSINPKDGTAEPVTVDGKPIDSGKLSDQDKLMIQFHNQLSEIAARGDQTIKNTQEKGNQDRTTEGVKQAGRETLQSEKSGDSTTTTDVKDATGKTLGTKTVTRTVPKKPNVQPQKQRKQIPGTDKFAVSSDGGKTWKAE